MKVYRFRKKNFNRKLWIKYRIVIRKRKRKIKKYWECRKRKKDKDKKSKIKCKGYIKKRNKERE